MNKKQSTAIIIEDPIGRILFLKRASLDTFEPNTICLAGGGIDFDDQSPEDACLRELKEETMLEVDNIKLLKLVELPEIDIYYYHAIVNELEPTVILDSKEHDNYMWLSEEEWLNRNDLILDLKQHLIDYHISSNDPIIHVSDTTIPLSKLRELINNQAPNEKVLLQKEYELQKGEIDSLNDKIDSLTSSTDFSDESLDDLKTFMNQKDELEKGEFKVIRSKLLSQLNIDDIIPIELLPDMELISGFEFLTLQKGFEFDPSKYKRIKVKVVRKGITNYEYRIVKIDKSEKHQENKTSHLPTSTNNSGDSNTINQPTIEVVDFSKEGIKKYKSLGVEVFGSQISMKTELYYKHFAKFNLYEYFKQTKGILEEKGLKVKKMSLTFDISGQVLMNIEGPHVELKRGLYSDFDGTDKYLHNHIFNIATNKRGGVALPIMQSCYELQKEAGIDKIQLYANMIDESPVNGANTWGKYGFTCNNKNANKIIQQVMSQIDSDIHIGNDKEGNMIWYRITEEDADEVAQIVSDFYQENDIRTQFPIHLIHDKLGKTRSIAIMQKVEWAGMLDLSNSQQLKMWEVKLYGNK